MERDEGITGQDERNFSENSSCLSYPSLDFTQASMNDDNYCNTQHVDYQYIITLFELRKYTKHLEIKKKRKFATSYRQILFNGLRQGFGVWRGKE